MYNANLFLNFIYIVQVKSTIYATSLVSNSVVFLRFLSLYQAKNRSGLQDNYIYLHVWEP